MRFKSVGFSQERLMRYLTALGDDAEIVVHGRDRRNAEGRLTVRSREIANRVSMSGHSMTTWFGRPAHVTLLYCLRRCRKEARDGEQTRHLR